MRSTKSREDQMRQVLVNPQHRKRPARQSASLRNLVPRRKQPQPASPPELPKGKQEKPKAPPKVTYRQPRPKEK
jgi:hypothetical protein